MQKVLKIVGFLGVLTILFALVHGGNLEPPGPPAPTMKTLDQVEPRIPIHLSDLPLTISSPGSFYLAENITTSGSGITIASDDVTIDLKGFSLAGGSGDGIFVSGRHKNIEIKNGTIRGWIGNGINAADADYSHFVDLRLSDNGGNGLSARSAPVINNVTANSNGGNGIEASVMATIANCTAFLNQNNGIMVSTGSVISNSTVRENVLNGILGSNDNVVSACSAIGNGDWGIWLQNDGGVIVDSVSRGNGAGIFVGEHGHIRNCQVERNAGIGIRVNAGPATIKDNTVTSNGSFGIGAESFSYIAGNTVFENGSVITFSAQISVCGSRNRIEDNLVDANLQSAYEISVVCSGKDNLIIKNQAAGNATSSSYNLPSGQLFGPIVTMPAGGADLSTVTNGNHPHANFKF